MKYLDFDKLVREICKLANERVPCYTVIRDMFDTIDFKGDQVIDQKEWNLAFGNIITVAPKVSVKATE